MSIKKNLYRDQLKKFGLGAWDESGLLLVTFELFTKIPNGACLTNIFGNKVIKGKNKLPPPLDTRSQWLSFGVMPDQYKEAFEWFDAD